jgi:glutamine synthetase
MKVFLEYIWLDGYGKEPNIRSKTKIMDWDEPANEFDLEKVPHWNFDGSSTMQAEGHSSDCLLVPVRAYRDPFRKKSMAFLILCEVMDKDGNPHESNHRNQIPGDIRDTTWWGYEQEYVLSLGGRPLGFPGAGYPGPQGPYYCANGTGNVSGRDISESHLDACLVAGLSITGTNAEVLLGQWEYQLFGKGAREAADDLWISRFILQRVAEAYSVEVDLRPKPVQGDWNGSGMHTNFSDSKMREFGGEELFQKIFKKFEEKRGEMIPDYGSDNHLRLTGKHETQSIDKFSFGVSDRGASIRIPASVVSAGWKGYLEDRRPASNANPYLVAKWIKSILDEIE